MMGSIQPPTGTFLILGLESGLGRILYSRTGLCTTCPERNLGIISHNAEIVPYSDIRFVDHFYYFWIHKSDDFWIQK